MIYEQNNKLYLRNGNEVTVIEPWHCNSLRVRSTRYPEFSKANNALLASNKEFRATIEISDNLTGCITNGKISCRVDSNGALIFYNQKGDLLLKGYQRNRNDTMSTTIEKDKVEHFNSALNINSREFKPLIGGDYQLTVRFEPNKDEKLFGMGQYQQDFLDLKNAHLELAHRNSQASVPFVLSNIGYGFLWNNPAIGEVTFGKNITEWKAYSTKEMDFWITAGDTPNEIEEHYADVTGKVPMMPEYGLGYWQCKLRYRTQEELLDAAREFKKRNLPINVIVADYFHWPKSGEYCFDKNYWPDPKAMVDELNEMGIKLMVSIWPTVDHTSSHYKEMQQHGYLVQVERGVPITMDFLGNNGFIDFTNPEARKYLWNLVKKNYFDDGIEVFWLDEAEPEYTIYDFDNYRYYEGTNLQYGNKYPVAYSQAFYEGLQAEGRKDIVNLVRCAWAGSQKYGALVWSGDIDSSFQSLRNQLTIGLNMGIAGIPWWTTDIGGFHGGVDEDPSFRELLIRWFQFGTFSPVMRMHGDREPHTNPLSNAGGGKMPSGAPTEPWAYGEEAYEILKKYMFLRENMKSYIRQCMKDAHEKGTPVIRPLFYDFSSDDNVWNIEDQYMFGPDILIAPILYENIKERKVYLPNDQDWINAFTGEIYIGGQEILASAKIDTIPVFIKSNKKNQLYSMFNVFH